MTVSEIKLTIALVTWNARENVEALLAAIHAFTLAPYELVIVDNGSTDGTLGGLRALLGKDGYTLVENGRNLRCAHATNQAIALTRTDYLVYMCASHALVTAPGWDEALVSFMEANPDTDLAGDLWNPYGLLHPSRYYRAGWSPAAHGRERLLHVQGGAWIARRSLFDDVGAFDSDEYPHGGMDIEFSYRLLSHGRRLGRCPAIAAPPWPEKPELTDGVFIVHPASSDLRLAVRSRLARFANPSAQTERGS